MLNPATPPTLPAPPFLWEKSEPPLFENFEFIHPLYETGGSKYALAF